MSPFRHRRLVLLILASCLPLACGVGVTVMDGDVYVDVILSLYANSNGTCGTIDPEAVQNLYAIIWTFDKLNTQNYLNGATIGVRVHKTCGIVDEAASRTQGIATELYKTPENMTTVGVIGSDLSSETEAVSRLLGSLPAEFRLLQLSYQATASSLRDKDRFPNFFRTIPPDDIQVEVINAFLRDITFTYIAVVYDDDAYGRGSVEALNTSTKSTDVCLGLKIAINPTDSEEITLTMLTRTLTDIRSMNATDGSLPRGGILHFGSLKTGKLLMQAIEQVYMYVPDLSIDLPVLLFSEGSSYFEGQFLNVSKGAFILSPPRRTISDFKRNWTNILLGLNDSNTAVAPYKWLREMYEHKFGCILASSCTQKTEKDISDKFPPSLFTLYAIQAALTLAKVTKNVATAVCDSQTLCIEFFSTPRQTFIDEMDNLMVRFDDEFIDEFKPPNVLEFSFDGTAEVQMPPVSPVYKVYNHQRCESDATSGFDDFCFVEVANYYGADDFRVTKTAIKDYATADGTELPWPDIRKAQCPDGAICPPCLKEATEDDILFIPGDIYVVGIVPVHSVGATPLKCGGLSDGGLDVVEVIRFAITDAKAIFAGQVPDADIGVIVIDSCYDAELTQEKVLSLHRHGVYMDGTYIPVNDKILGYIAGRSSHVSIAVAEILSRLGFVQISYASTATVLSKRSLYPYFLRVPGPDSSQVDTMLNVVHELGANYVQIIHADTAYGNGGRDLIMDKVGSMNICVAQAINITHVDTTKELVYKIRRYPKAKVLLFFVSSFEMTWLLEALHENFDRNEFVYIASEDWGRRDIDNDYTNLIDTITLSIELPSDPKYKDHLKELTPHVPDADPWIRDYMEHQFECYYQWSYNKSSGSPCSGDERLDADNQNYKIDPWAVFAQKAVYALLKGALPAMNELCSSSTELCPAFRDNPDVFFASIAEVRLDDRYGYLDRVFDDNGDGLSGYKINVITFGVHNDYEYIGEANAGVFHFNKEMWQNLTGLVADVNSSCSSRDVCPECFPDSESVVIVKQCDTRLAPGVIAILVALSLMCCATTGILLYICNRHGCCIRLVNGKPSFTSTYLSPIHRSSRPCSTAGGEKVSVTMHRCRPATLEVDMGSYDYIPHDRVSGDCGGCQLPRLPDRDRDTDRSSGYLESRGIQHYDGTSVGSYSSRSRSDVRYVNNPEIGSGGDINQCPSNDVGDDNQSQQVAE